MMSVHAARHNLAVPLSRRVADGIILRHRAGCPADVDRDDRCRCSPAYRAFVWLRDPAAAGKGRKVMKTFASLEEAKAWRGARLSDKHQRRLRSEPKERREQTLRTAAEELLAGMRTGAIRKRGGGEYRPGVIRAYDRALASYVLPEIGAHRLCTISQPDLIDLVERMQERGLSASTIRNALDPVRVIYRRAVRRGLVPANPAAGIELPAGERPRDRVADPQEATRLVAALTRPADRAMWAVALYCGLRAGELRALRWEHVDLAGGVIHVRENLPVDAPRQYADVETLDPKSKAGRRQVPIPPPARDALVEWRAAGAAARDALVWSAEDGGPFARTSIIKRARAAWAAAELEPIGLHEARHSCASMWIASGWDLKTVSQLLGHSGIQITLDRYGHLFPSHLNAAAAAFAAYLERADTDHRLGQLD